MHKGTEVLRSKEASLQEEMRRSERKRALEAARLKQEEALAKRNLRRRKQRAARKVHKVANRAVTRLDANDGAGWKEMGYLLKVCKRSGPHLKFFCFFHSQKLAVVSIPDTQKREYFDGKYRTTCVIVGFMLGADGYVYRTGLNKNYRAQLVKRDWPKEILALAVKINRIYS